MATSSLGWKIQRISLGHSIASESKETFKDWWFKPEGNRGQYKGFPLAKEEET